MKKHSIFAAALAAASSVTAHAQANTSAGVPNGIVDCSSVLARQRSPEACAQNDRTISKTNRTASTTVVGKGVPTAPQFTVRERTSNTTQSENRAAAATK
jgi:hypothetical protein